MERFGEVQFGFDLGKDFTMLSGLYSGDFLAPECFVGLGDGVLGATSVAVPEAAVDEDDCAILRQDEVGGAGEAPIIDLVYFAAKSVVMVVQERNLSDLLVPGI